MRAQRGMSLVEVLVALLILTVVITSSLMAFLERNKRLQQASEIVLAYQSLANEAEYLRRVEYGLLKTSTKFQSDTTLLKPLQPFETTVVVNQVRDGVKNVEMTIHWRDRQRNAKLSLLRVDTGGTNLW
jgi:prepilin-type N-terminal cleavage/methylation domain-containing protein